MNPYKAKLISNTKYPTNALDRICKLSVYCGLLPLNDISIIMHSHVSKIVKSEATDIM